MSDFLKNLRSGQDNKPNRYGNKPYHHESRQFSGNEKRNGPDRRTGRHHKSNQKELLPELLYELTPAIKKFLENITNNQKRLIEVEETKAKAEEQKSKAFENLMEYLKSEGIETILNAKDSTRKKRRARKPLDANRRKVMQIIAKMRSKGETFDKIALYLEKEKLQTFSNRGQWHAQTVHRLYQDHVLT